MSFVNHKLHMLRSNDGKNQEIWVAEEEWMRPRDIISEGSEMPHEVMGLLKKWSKEINQIRSDFQSKADIGCAHVDFVYDSSVYKLQPGAIAATKDMFHHIAEVIQKDLKQIGCPYIRYHWDFD
ncbi:hypothetical protein [Anaerotignum sp.]